jgi:hypothetical protein
VTCAVSDTGIGIAPENLDRVFEEFFQVRGRLQEPIARDGSGPRTQPPSRRGAVLRSSPW